jgi:hypothetical protein
MRAPASAMPDPTAHRQVARRDARLEGEIDHEPDADSSERPMKDAQRDLTSLSGPVDRPAHDDEDPS